MITNRFPLPRERTKRSLISRGIQKTRKCSVPVERVVSCGNLICHLITLGACLSLARADLRVSHIQYRVTVVIDTNNYNCATHKAVIEKAISENPDAKWRVVMFHQDIYGSGLDHSDSVCFNVNRTFGINDPVSVSRVCSDIVAVVFGEEVRNGVLILVAPVFVVVSRMGFSVAAQLIRSRI